MTSNSSPCPESLPSLGSVANSTTKEHQQRLQANDSTYRQPFPPAGGRTSEGNIRNEEQRKQKRKFSNKLKPHERFKQHQLLLEETFTSKNYKEFFNIKLKENLKLANINVIKANKQMTAQLKGRQKSHRTKRRKSVGGGE